MMRLTVTLDKEDIKKIGRLAMLTGKSIDDIIEDLKTDVKQYISSKINEKLAEVAVTR